MRTVGLHVAFWPIATQNDVRSHVGDRGAKRTRSGDRENDANDPEPSFIRQSSCKRRPDNSCPCNGVEPTPADIPPYDIPRPGPTRASASGPNFPLKNYGRLGHDVAAADIDAGGREGAVRLLGGGGGRDGGAGF